MNRQPDLYDFEIRTSHDIEALYKAHDYSLQHSITHLFRANESKTLFRILLGNSAWFRVKSERLRSAAACVPDLDLAIQSAIVDPTSPNNLVALIGLHTFRHLTNSRINAYNNQDVETLVLLGREMEAFAYVDLRIDAKDKVNGLITIANAYHVLGRNCFNILHEAEGLLPTITDLSKRITGILDVALAFYKNAKNLTSNKVKTLLEHAEAMALDIPDNGRRSVALLEITTGYCRINAFLDAERTSSLIPNIGRKNSALCILATDLARSQQLNRARTIATSIPDPAKQASALCHLIIALAHDQFNKNEREIAQLLDYVTDLVNTVDEDWRQVNSLSIIATTMVQVNPMLSDNAQQLFDQAQIVAVNIENTGKRSSAIHDLASAYVNLKQYAQARQLDESFQDLEQRSSALRALSSALAKDGAYDEAELVARSIETLPKRGLALRNLALSLLKSQAKYTTPPAVLFDEGLELEQSSSTSKNEVQLLLSLLKAFREISNGSESLYRRLIELTEARIALLPAEQERSANLQILAKILAQSRQLNYARRIASQIPTSGRQSAAYYDVVIALAEEGYWDEAIEFSSTIENEVTKAVALSNILSTISLRETGKSYLQQEAIIAKLKALSDLTTSPWSKTVVLQYIAHALMEYANTEQELISRYISSAIEEAFNVTTPPQRAVALVDCGILLLKLGPKYKDKADDLLKAGLGIIYVMEDKIRASTSLRDIASRLINAKEYTIALTLIPQILNPEQRIPALRNLLSAYYADDPTNIQRIEPLVEEILREITAIRSDGDRSASYRAFIPLLVQLGYISQAIEAAHSIPLTQTQNNAFRDLSIALSKQFEFIKGLEILRSLPLNDYVLTLIAWTPSLEQYSNGLGLAALLVVLRIACWTYKEWKPILEVLSEELNPVGN